MRRRMKSPFRIIAMTVWIISLKILCASSVFASLITAENTTAMDIVKNQGTLTAEHNDDSSSAHGWLLISSVHEANFENDPYFNFDYYSRANLSIGSYSGDDDDSPITCLSKNTIGPIDIIGVGMFFKISELGYLSAVLDDSAVGNRSIHPDVPLPGTIWLSGSCIFGVMLLRRGKQRGV